MTVPIAEADRFVAVVRDFNAEALPWDDDGQAACGLTAVALVGAVVRCDQDLTSEVGCNQHGRTRPRGQHPSLREAHRRMPWGSAALSLAADRARQDGYRSVGGPSDALTARVERLDVAVDETGAQ